MAETQKKYLGYGYHGGGRKPTGVKRVTFCVSCQPEQLKAIKLAATKAGKTVSRFLVDSVLEKT